jgi:hypothetical protein
MFRRRSTCSTKVDRLEAAADHECEGRHTRTGRCCLERSAPRQTRASQRSWGSEMPDRVGARRNARALLSALSPATSGSKLRGQAELNRRRAAQAAVPPPRDAPWGRWSSLRRPPQGLRGPRETTGRSESTSCCNDTLFLHLYHIGQVLRGRADDQGLQAPSNARGRSRHTISYLRPFSRGAREPRKPEMPPNHTAKWQRKWPTGGGQLRARRAEQRELKKDAVPSPERSS